MLRTAAVLSIAVLCSLTLFCQAVHPYWRDEFAREEGFVEDAAAHISSELEALIEQKTEGKVNTDSYIFYTIVQYY